MKHRIGKLLALMTAVVTLLGFAVYGLSTRIQSQMERSATESVEELVQIMESSIAELRKNDVAMAGLLAAAFSADDNPQKTLERLQASSLFKQISFVPTGASSGVSSSGDSFTPSAHIFHESESGGSQAVTDVYMSSLGAWTYTVRCPVYQEERLMGELYVDVVMERYDDILPGMIYQSAGLVYVLDSNTHRFIYEPTTTEVYYSSKYDLHGFFSDFGILDKSLEQDITDAIAGKKSTIARMPIDGKASYLYFWPIDQGAWYLCGIIPEQSIQSESKAVTQTIALVSILILSVAILIFWMFYWNGRRSRKERQYQIDLFHGIAKSIDHVVLLFDCGTGKLELAFDNIHRVLGINLQQMNQFLEEKQPSASYGDEQLMQFLRSKKFQDGLEFSEKILWTNPETGAGQFLEVETSYILLDKKKKCILSILDVTKEEQMQESLRASALAAQNASRVKSDFLSQMSHEIRTPMNAVMGMVQIAEARLDDRERVADCLKKIGSSSRHLLGLINDILDISKVESQKLSLSECWFGLDDLLSDIQDIIAVQASGRKQDFKIQNKAGTVELLADRTRLSQVLVNLLNNSVKYTPVGGTVSLWVDAVPSRNCACRVLHFYVQDNGIGMSEEFLKKLFIPFEREDDQDVRAQTGTGLGLAIVQSMVSLMGGSIRVESAKGAGTSFTVDLELPYKTAVPSVSASDAEQSATDLHQIMVLVAEDNEINREITAEFLQMANAAVESAVDGVDAFEKFRDSQPGYYGLILMDMQMPRWNGLEASRQIRALNRPDAKTVPIIAVTANAYFEDEQNCLQAGMDGHLSKPLEMWQFYQTVKKYLPDAAEGEAH